MNVIFLAPEFPANQRNFVRALHGVGARVIGFGERPADWLDDELKHLLAHYEQVPSVVDEEAVYYAVRRCQSKVWIDRLEATVEAHVINAAKVRERTGIPGVSLETTLLCRDKFLMKRYLRDKGIPCARNAAVGSVDDIVAFAEEVGFPIILKPRDAAGAAGTHKISSREEIATAAAAEHIDRGRQGFVVEEFISGHEGFWDTLTVDGEVAWEGISHYYPGVLEAMRTRWISPQIVTTNRLGAEGYQELREFGREVVRALGITTAATHMEWFYGPKGLSFSEIGCRPPGCMMWDIYNWANDDDLYHHWAMGICWGKAQPRPSRRYAAGLVTLRPNRDGHIAGYSGIDAVHARCGDGIIDMNLPSPGTPTSPVEAGFVAQPFVRMRHPDYDECRRMLDFTGEHLKVWAH